MEIVRLDNKPANWDEVIKDYDTKTLFHETAWLDHIQTIHNDGWLEFFEIREKDRRLGYFCAFVIKKAFLKVYGSPLAGTGTNFLGPLVNHDVDQDALVKALQGLVRWSKFAHLELANEWFDIDIMRTQGFEVHPSVTHVIELPDNEEDAWKNLKSACRNRVRKAEKNGMKVEVIEDLTLADEYYEQFIEVYGKQGMVTPFGVERPRSLMQCLVPGNRILPLRISLEGEAVATGLFPYDENCIYFWGAASWLKYHKLCPNELLHWEVIKHALTKGIPRYNMCGGTSQFKSKFGGADVPYNHYSKSSLPMMKQARKLYKKAHHTRLKVTGWLRASRGKIRAD